MTEATVVEVTAQGALKMTDALRGYVDEKIGGVLGKFTPTEQEEGGSTGAHHSEVLSCHTKLRVQKAHFEAPHEAEVVVTCKGGIVIRVEESTVDMYASIDKVADKLSRSLRCARPGPGSAAAFAHASAVSMAARRKVKERKLGAKSGPRVADVVGDGAMDDEGDEDFGIDWGTF